MTITKIRPVPTSLPHARLYLDDVQEISDIFLNADVDPIQKPTITYGYADIRVDSIQDLRDRGGSTSELTIEIQVAGGASSSIRISGNYSSLYLSSFANLDPWAVHGRVKSVFDARRLVLKNFYGNLPPAVQGILSAFVLIAFAIQISLLTLNLRVRSYVISGSCLLLVAIVAWFVSRPSRVYFVDSHERSKLSAETKRGYVRDTVMLILGVVIGKGIPLLLEKLLK